MRPTGATYNMTDTQSGVFGANTRLIRVAASTEARIVVGVTPVIGPSSLLIPAGAIDYFPVQPGEKVACSGTVNIAECG